MKVAILGFGIQGRSNYRYYKDLGAQITICDQNEDLTELPAAVKTQLGENYLQNLSRFDVLVRTSSLKPRLIQAANPENVHILDKITTASNEFLKLTTTPTIAITGTKGKGTTSMVLEAICQVAQIKSVLLGNIGTPPLDLLKDAQGADLSIFEIASCQTIDLRYSPPIAVCLNIFPEHLDWHLDYDDYINCKAQLFKYQQKTDLAIYNLGDLNSKKIAKNGRARLVSYNAANEKADVHIKNGSIRAFNETVARTSDIKLLGQHNQQNVCAAIAALLSFKNTDDIKKAIPLALRQISGFPSRLEKVRVWREITFIDDSHSTTPESTIAALAAITDWKILIAGGYDKKVDLTNLARKIVDSQIRHLILIGETAPTLYKLLGAHRASFSIDLDCRTMPQIIDSALSKARAKDTVLLSPGCASFGLFKSYADRSRQFQAVVHQLD